MITKSASNQQPNQMIRNVVQRVHEESKIQSCDQLAKEESEIAKLAHTLCAKNNTFLSWQWIAKIPTHYQAHLERISDYLKYGEGVWWESDEHGVEFFDTGSSAAIGPYLHHFRSTTTIEVQIELLHCWEECCEKETPLPAKEIRHYINGSVANIDIHDNQPSTIGNEVDTVKSMTENDVPRVPQEVVHITCITPEQDEQQAQNLHVGVPAKKDSTLKTYKTSLGNAISYLPMKLFRNLITFDNA